MGAEMIHLGIGNALPNRGTFTVRAPLPAAPAHPLQRVNFPAPCPEPGSRRP